MVLIDNKYPFIANEQKLKKNRLTFNEDDFKK